MGQMLLCGGETSGLLLIRVGTTTCNSKCHGKGIPVRNMANQILQSNKIKIPIRNLLYETISHDKFRICPFKSVTFD